MAEDTGIEQVKNITKTCLDTLDFQTTMIMWLAQYGWILIILGLILGTFLVVRNWKEWGERQGILANILQLLRGS